MIPRRLPLQLIGCRGACLRHVSCSSALLSFACTAVPSSSSPNKVLFRVCNMPGAVFCTGPCKMDKVLVFIGCTFQRKVRGKAIRGHANKQQDYQVVPFATKKIILDRARECAQGYFWWSGQGRILSEAGFEAETCMKEGADVCRSGGRWSWRREVAVQRPCDRAEL